MSDRRRSNGTFTFGITEPGGWWNCPTVEGIERAAAAGVEGIEFFGWEDEETDAIRAAAAEHGIEVFGTLAAGAGSNAGTPDEPSLTDPAAHDRAVTDLTRSIEATADVGGSTLVVTVGPEREEHDRATQRGAIVEALSAVAADAEAAGVTLVVEPLNTKVDHPGYFLTASAEGLGIVREVESQNVKLLFDVYHQQITEGDVTRSLTRNVEAIGHVHVADNPGRHEPGTGELDYGNVLAALDDAGYDGAVSCECSPTGDPDEVVAALVALADRARGR